MARLEQMIFKLRGQIDNDESKTIDRMLRIAERISRYCEWPRPGRSSDSLATRTTLK